MIEKAKVYLKQKINERKSGLKITLFNALGNLITVFINFWLPYILNIEYYSEFVITFSFFIVLTTFFTFGLNSLTLKYSCVSYTNLKPVLLLTWIIYLIPSIFVLLILYKLGYSELFFNYDYIDLIKLLIGASLTSFQRISLSFFIGTNKLNSYGFSILSSKGVQSILILISVIINSNSFVENLPNIFLIQGFFNFIFLVISGFYLKFNKITILKSLSLFIENKFLFLNTIFQTMFSGYGLSFFLSPIMLAKDIGLFNIFNQINNLSVFISNGLNEGYLKGFLKTKKIKITAVNNFRKYINVNNKFILIPLFILSFIYLIFSSSYSYGIYALPIYIIIMIINPYRSIYLNVLIFYKQSKIIFISSTVYYILNISTTYLSYKYFGFNGMIIFLIISFCSYFFILKFLSNKILFKNV